MNKNQKIAVGCGGAGCLGLIVVAIAGGALYYLKSRPDPSSASRNFNFNTNSNSNQNQNSDSSSNSTASTLSDDDKHKLLQAATMARDADLLQRVLKHLRFQRADGTPTDEYPEFIKDHIFWGLRNTDFINSLDTPEKARAYVDAHMD